MKQVEHDPKSSSAAWQQGFKHYCKLARWRAVQRRIRRVLYQNDFGGLLFGSMDFPFPSISRGLLIIGPELYGYAPPSVARS
jgi:hypothetical protein